MTDLCEKKTFVGWVVCLAIGWSGGTAQAEDANNPDLYLDGNALANALTETLLEENGVSQEDRLKQTTRLPLRSLRDGMQIPLRKKTQKKRSVLIDWLNAQDEASVTPLAVAKKAIALHGGNVEEGLAYVWNVLSYGWNDDKWRNELSHIRALQDITGELRTYLANYRHDPQSFFTLRLKRVGGPTIRGKLRLHEKSNRGDNFSAWYHFFGTALLAFHTANRRGARFGQAYANAMVFVEEYVAFNQYVDPQKRRNIDRAGAAFGAQLHRNLVRFETSAQFRSSPAARHKKFLYDNPRVYGPSWRLKPGQRPQEYGRRWYQPATVVRRLGAYLQNRKKNQGRPSAQK